ncbi:MAG: hypothetical protein LBN02_00630 [Oscillospiraceae bacterium]|jgi:hypothetical protein|nr:hypothetical protein [Oscillospiraceae bacterium]
MSAKKLTIIAVAGTVFVAAMLIIFLWLPNLPSAPSAHPLPSANPSPTATNPNGALVESVTITPENVREVVATLRRPESYSRNLLIENFWEPNGSAVYNLTVAVARGSIRVRNAAAGKTIIVRDGTVYIAYDGDPRTYTAPISDAGLARELDEYAMIPTYEDILDLDTSQILSAELRADPATFEPLIVVTARRGDLGYVTEYTVSVSLGLLVRAETSDNGVVVSLMTGGGVDLAEPEAEVFYLRR